MSYLKTFLPYLFGNKKGKSLDAIFPKVIPWEALNFEEKLTFHTLKNSLNSFVQTLNFSDLTDFEIYHLLNFKEFMNEEINVSLRESFSSHLVFQQMALKASALTPFLLQELLDFKINKVAVYVVLNSDRKRPGCLFIKDKEGNFIRNKNQDIFSLPILGRSERALNFNHSNGQTPTGLYNINSVMPRIDQNYEFGNYRRLIINFIKKEAMSISLNEFLPKSHLGLDWWWPSILARDLGRSLLRIHGTGKVNCNPFDLSFPHVGTSGCLSTRETHLMGFFAYNDQRILLDALMTAHKLTCQFENEVKIEGPLYVVEFNDSLSTLRF